MASAAALMAFYSDQQFRATDRRRRECEKLQGVMVAHSSGVRSGRMIGAYPLSNKCAARFLAAPPAWKYSTTLATVRSSVMSIRAGRQTPGDGVGSQSGVHYLCRMDDRSPVYARGLLSLVHRHEAARAEIEPLSACQDYRRSITDIGRGLSFNSAPGQGHSFYLGQIIWSSVAKWPAPDQSERLPIT